MLALAYWWASATQSDPAAPLDPQHPASCPPLKGWIQLLDMVPWADPTENDVDFAILGRLIFH